MSIFLDASKYNRFSRVDGGDNPPRVGDNNNISTFYRVAVSGRKARPSPLKTTNKGNHMLGKLESGQVVRHVGTRGAFAVEETINLPDGRSFPKTYTVWADQAPPIGSIVQVTGELTVKTREYPAPSGMKTAIDINFNNPNVTIMGAPMPETPAQVAEAIQDIAENTIKELPF